MCNTGFETIVSSFLYSSKVHSHTVLSVSHFGCASQDCISILIDREVLVEGKASSLFRVKSWLTTLWFHLASDWSWNNKNSRIFSGVHRFYSKDCKKIESTFPLSNTLYEYTILTCMTEMAYRQYSAQAGFWLLQKTWRNVYKTRETFRWSCQNLTCSHSKH